MGERPWWLQLDGSPPWARMNNRQSRLIQFTTSALCVVAVIWLPSAWEKVTGFLVSLVLGLAAQLPHGRATRGREQPAQQRGTT